MPEKPLVGIVMGSDTDLPVMTEAAQTLKKFEIPFEIEITSAHRSPVRTSEYARTAVQRGLKAIIVGAGGASHLAGVIASETILPVIGVPMATTTLAGLDALLSTVQMPGGVPVACTAIGKPGRHQRRHLRRADHRHLGLRSWRKSWLSTRNSWRARSRKNQRSSSASFKISDRGQ